MPIQQSWTLPHLVSNPETFRFFHETCLDVCAHPDVQSEDEMEEQAIIRVVVIVREQGIGRWQVQALRVWSTPPSYAAELVRRQEALSTNCASVCSFSAPAGSGTCLSRCRRRHGWPTKQHFFSR